ncbi:MAG: hypothetical protein M1817_000427 [Caeruleum heppii]|nr:MAG: hypothetical protein M1817_000427 [Caeruleum heppii]
MSLRSYCVSLVSYAFMVLAVQAQASEPGSSSESGNAGGVDNESGASGSSQGAFNLSRGGMIAIIIVAAAVGIGGIASGILFYVAKKRQWEIRKSIRRSARRLTGNHSTAKAQKTSRRQRGLSRIPESTDLPQRKDVEKGQIKVTSTFEVETPAQKPWGQSMSGLGKKIGR